MLLHLEILYSPTHTQVSVGDFLECGPLNPILLIYRVQLLTHVLYNNLYSDMFPALVLSCSSPNPPLLLLLLLPAYSNILVRKF